MLNSNWLKERNKRLKKMVKENTEQPTLTSTPSNSNLKEKKVNNTKKLNKRVSFFNEFLFIL